MWDGDIAYVHDGGCSHIGIIAHYRVSLGDCDECASTRTDGTLTAFVSLNIRTPAGAFLGTGRPISSSPATEKKTSDMS